MSDLQPSGSVAIARQLAATHPNASLPCPLCAATPKAANFERHLGKAHAEYAHPGGPSPSGPLRVRGVDRSLSIPSIVLMVVWGAGFMAVTITSGGQFSGTTAAILGVSCALALGLMGATFGGLFKATLELDGEVVRVRRLLGLATKQLRLPVKLETGAFMQKKASDIAAGNENLATVEVRAGAYLRLRNDGTITIGAPGAPGLGKHWAQKGWSKGKKTRRADIEIDRDGLVALEYRLAARGQLTPKGG